MRRLLLALMLLAALAVVAPIVNAPSAAFAGGDTNPPTPGDDPVSPEEDGGNSHGFAIVLFVVYVAAAVGVGYVLVRNPSRSDGSAPDAA